MIREVLYRGKRVDNGEWVYGYYVEKVDPLLGTKKSFVITQELDCNGIYNSLVSWYEVDPSTIGQYTGLTDKNGVKVFEDDVIECDNWYIGGLKAQTTKFFVSFLDDAFCAGTNPLSTWLFDSINGNRALSDVIVFGNVHDHPELLST